MIAHPVGIRGDVEGQEPFEVVLQVHDSDWFSLVGSYPRGVHPGDPPSQASVDQDSERVIFQESPLRCPLPLPKARTHLQGSSPCVDRDITTAAHRRCHTPPTGCSPRCSSEVLYTSGLSLRQ
ncbi:hypothetical protein KTR9_4958 (plasmid) [Gordonia sp. KTR9]|nr:hypothetical protein KTR9_4958 [Gordonia sp. KTR9]